MKRLNINVFVMYVGPIKLSHLILLLENVISMDFGIFSKNHTYYAFLRTEN